MTDIAQVADIRRRTAQVKPLSLALEVAVVTGRLRYQDRRAPRCQRLGEATGNLVAHLTFKRNVERLHAIGPRVVGELLTEIGEQRSCQTFIGQRLEVYAALDPEIVRALKGDQFPRPPLHKAPS